MCDLLKKLNFESEFTYKRCGEIVVAPERNIFALYCNLCDDIFMRMQEFVRHARREHDDEYEFEISKEDNVDVYDIEEITGGMTFNEIDAAERAEWLRRKKLIHMDKEKLEATSFQDHTEVAKVLNQDKIVLAEQENVTLTEKTLAASATTRKALIEELETPDGFDIILENGNSLNWHDEDNSVYKSPKIIVDDDIIQAQVDVFQEIAPEKTLQFIDWFSDTNIVNTEDSLISEEIMNSLVLRSIDIENLINCTTETLIPAEKKSSLVLAIEDLANILKNKKESRTSEQNVSSLVVNNNDLSDLQKNKNVLLISEEHVNCLTLKNPDLTDLKKTTNMLSTTQEETNSLALETPDLAAIPINKNECVISDENIVITNESLISEKNSNSLMLQNADLADLQEIQKKSSILEESIKSLPLENPDIADMQNTTKGPSISKKTTDSLKLVNPELVDLLTEFEVDFDSFDIPKKSSVLQESMKSLPLENLNTLKLQNTDLADLKEIPKKSSILEESMKSLPLENPNIADMQNTTKEPFISKEPTDSLKLVNPELVDLLTEFEVDLDSFDMKIFEKLMSPKKTFANDKEISFHPLQQRTIEVGESMRKDADKPKKAGGEIITDNISKVSKKRGRPRKQNKYLLEDNQNNDKSTEVQYSTLNSNAVKLPTLKIKEVNLRNRSFRVNPTPSLNPDPTKTLSPDEAKFNKSLKVRIKKLSPAPKIDETNNDCKSMVLDLESKMPEKHDNPLLSKSTVNVSQTLKNLSVVAMEAATPVKNTYCKQNFTEQILKDINMKNSAKDIKNLGDIGGTQFHSSVDIKQMIRTRKASIDVLPNIENIIETPLNKNKKHNRINTISRTTHKNLLIQRMAQIRKRISQVIDDGKFATEANLNDTKLFDKENVKFTNNLSDDCKESHKIEVQNVTILQPHTSIKIEPLPSFDVFKNPLVKLGIVTKIKDESQLLSDTSTTQIINNKSLLNQSLKSKIKISPKNTPKHSDVADLEADSVVSSVQNDYSQNKLDVSQLDILQQDVSDTNENLTKQSKNEYGSASIVEELLDQVAKEKQENKRTATELKEKSMDAIEISINYEMELLDKIGLNFIKKSPTETLSLDHEEEMHSKAKKFADILKNNSLVWNIRDAKHKIAKERELSFNLIKQAANSTLAVNLTLTDVKRVCNLIMSWYSNQNNSKLIDKKETPKSLKKFFELFIFIPKTGRPIYNCEFCDDQFRSEHLYGKHRCTHTGGAPYNCAYCGKAFSRSTSFKSHESKHVEIINMKLQQKQTTVYSPLSKYNVQSRIKLKREHSPDKSAIENDAKRHKIDQTTKECNLCYEKFKTPEELYAHKITHLKCVYKCKVCKKVLTSLTDMQTHVETFHK